MATAQSYNEDQHKFWNGPDGEFWTHQQELMDRTMSNLMAPLLEFAAPESGSTVIDVGCGCGATMLELARAVGPTGRWWASISPGRCWIERGSGCKDTRMRFAGWPMQRQRTSATSRPTCCFQDWE